MAITDLTGYTWTPKSTGIVAYTESATARFKIDVYTSYDATVRNYISTPQFGSGLRVSTVGIHVSAGMYYKSGDFGYTYTDQKGEGWYANSLKVEQVPIVYITGGTDVTNTDLIAWLEANGTLIPPQPVTGYSITYHSNGGTPEPENLTGQTTLPSQLPTVSKDGYTFDGWYTDSTFQISAVAGAEISADTDLYAKFTIELDTTMWELYTLPDFSTDLDVSIGYNSVSWNTCEYYDNGEVKIAAWSFKELQVSTNGYILWLGGDPNFAYFYNSQVFDAVVAQFEALGFAIDQSDIQSKSGYFYVEHINDTTGKFHNVRIDIIRFNSHDWNGNTDFTDWLTNSAGQLEEYIIPNDVVEIGLNAFWNCNSFETIAIPDSVTSIGDWAFCGCSSLTSITIPDSVTSIGEGAFAYCSSLTSIEIPDSVTSMGDSAFQDCSSLTSVIIGDAVTSIGNYAFAYCSSLTSVTITAIVPPSLGGEVFYNTNDCPIYVPAQSVDAYKTAWSEYADRIQASHITLDLSTIGLPAGTHSIQMKLSDDGVTKADSELSNAVSYTVASSETWVINETPDVSTTLYFDDITFTTGDGSEFDFIHITTLAYPDMRPQKGIDYSRPAYGLFDGWYNTSYRTVTFETAPTGDLLTWLQANAVKQ